nr:MAG TPA: hypothetical protein [Caudoviricetes sp.]
MAIREEEIRKILDNGMYQQCHIKEDDRLVIDIIKLIEKNNITISRASGALEEAKRLLPMLIKVN